jgi:hypothetical protein
MQPIYEVLCDDNSSHREIKGGFKDDAGGTDFGRTELSRIPFWSKPDFGRT